MTIDIPAEILMLIFLLCIEPDRWYDDLPTNAPRRLSHVCITWRNVALDTAQLWTTITFGKGYPRKEVHSEPHIDFARQAEWVRRSKGALLKIAVRDLSTAEGRHDAGVKARIQWIVELLRPKVDRWGTLSFEQTLPEQIIDFFQQAQGLDALNLEMLELHSNFAWRRSPIYAFGSAPSLKRLVSTVLEFKKPFVQSLRNLQHLEISAVNFMLDVAAGADEIVSLLRHSPSLECLKISEGNPSVNFYGQIRAVPTQNTFIHSRLTEIEIAPANLQEAVLSLIQLPAFSCYHRHYTPPEVLPIIQKYNPFPNMKHVRITDSGDRTYPLSELPGMLSGLHALESFMMERLGPTDPDVDPDWVAQFANICPSLKSLHLTWDLGISEDGVRAMVQGRIAWGKPLNSIALAADPSDVSEGFIPWLEANVAEVDVDVWV